MRSLVAEGLTYETVRHYLHHARWTVLRIYDTRDPVEKHIWDAMLTFARHAAAKTHRATSRFDLKALTSAYDWLAAPEYFSALFALVFMLRSSEYCQPAGRPAAAAERRPISFDDVSLCVAADGIEELRITIRRSKTDPTAKGSTHARRVTSDPRTCIVANYKRMLECVPPLERRGQLCRSAFGAPVTAVMMNTMLKRLHEAAGYPSVRISSHSLRKAGAERLWLATHDEMLVMREGRWESIKAMRTYVKLDTSAGAAATDTHAARRA